MFFSNNRQLVDFLWKEGLIHSSQIKEAFLTVDRKKFVPENFRDFAYFNQPILIANQQTISQPATVAIMLELLDIKLGHKVLDIGAGSGWVSCLSAYLVGKTGQVQAYELNEKVGAFGQKAVSNSNFKNIDYIISNASHYWEKEGPFDRIYVGAAFKKIPSSLISQLREGGILVAPTQQDDLRKITRIQNKIEERRYSGFVFVPFLNDKKKD